MGKTQGAKQQSLAVKPPKTWGTDELNFAEFPLAALTDHLSEGQRVLEFEDDVFDEASRQRVHRKLIISGSNLHGLPMPLDSDVLLIALDQTNRANAFTDRHVSFRRSEFLKRLHWDDSGKSYRRLDESLQRWAGTTLHYVGSWWDRRVNRWQSHTFHVLESLTLKGRRDNAADDSVCSFTWNEIVFNSFQANNIRRMDLDFYFSLKRPASRRIFRFLDKRFYHSHCLEFSLPIFACEHVGFSRSYDTAQLKRKMRPAIAELEQSGFIKSTSDEDRFWARARGEWFIRFEKAAAMSHKQSMPLAGQNPLVEKLMERGIQQPVAFQLVALRQHDTIQRQLDVFDWMKGRKDRRMSKNPPGYLVSAIREDFPTPAEFGFQLQRAKLSAAKRAAAKVVPIVEEVAPEDQKLDRMWEELSSEEKAAIEAEALANAAPALSEGLQRSRERGLTEPARQYHRMIVQEHLRKRAGL